MNANSGWRCGVLLGVSFGIACQNYDFAFQSDRDLQEVELNFAVQTPSQADILFVVDNSTSMTEEQVALSESFDAFIADLSASDTAYRIGIVSTDAVGWSSRLEGDCDFMPFPSPLENGFASKGNCDLVSVNSIAYPHDGARGRLLAAFDTEIYDINDPIFDSLSPDEKIALNQLFPNGPASGPCETRLDTPTLCDESNPPLRAQGTEGAEWVIDRELTNLNACKACGCAEGTCERGNACFDGCATNVSGAYISAAIRSNIRGLGIAGQGWEQGIRSALLSVGVEPANPTVELALDPLDDLTDPDRSAFDAPNTFETIDEVGNVSRDSWVRDEALFAVMYVTDEQDCSMSQPFFDNGKSCFEVGCEENPANNQPTGSVCYQGVGQANLISQNYMADLLLARKEGIRSRVAVGLIGGLVRPVEDNRSFATPTDCISNAEGEVGGIATECFCVTNLPDTRWCTFTGNGDGSSATCDALNGDRYTEFGDEFNRRTYESVCESDCSEALIVFGEIAKLSCFDLTDIRPADGNSSNIRVRRAERSLAEVGVEPVELMQTEDGSEEEGWFYVPAQGGRGDQICLNRVDRLIGDVYEISILTTDTVDPRRTQTPIPAE